MGIVIGIASIILIMSVGRGAENLIVDQISGLGVETLVIRPGREPKGPSDFGQTLFSDSLKSRDIELLRNKNNVPFLGDIAPAVIVPGSVSYGGETYRPTIFGWSAEFLAKTLNVYPETGQLFDETDIKQKAPVAVIGSKVKSELFGESDALGENIKIKNKNFRVIGVFPARGQVSFFNMDEVVLLPYSTAQSYLLGIDYYHEVVVKATSPDVINRTVQDIKDTLRGAHGITDPTKDDFFVVTQEGMVEQVRTIISVLTLFLSAVVAISLVVGGIGIMNIMLVSVSERTHEIGLRKAIGATDRDIMTQFLLEAVILTAVGGVIGIVLGALGSLAASVIASRALALGWFFAFPLSAVFLGLGVSAAVGLVFGIYPARQAAAKNPIEALRYE